MYFTSKGYAYCTIQNLFTSSFTVFTDQINSLIMTGDFKSRNIINIVEPNTVTVISVGCNMRCTVLFGDTMTEISRILAPCHGKRTAKRIRHELRNAFTQHVHVPGLMGRPSCSEGKNPCRSSPIFICHIKHLAIFHIFSVVCKWLKTDVRLHIVRAGQLLWNLLGILF